VTDPRQMTDAGSRPDSNSLPPLFGGEDRRDSGNAAVGNPYATDNSL